MKSTPFCALCLVGMNNLLDFSVQEYQRETIKTITITNPSDYPIQVHAQSFDQYAANVGYRVYESVSLEAHDKAREHLIKLLSLLFRSKVELSTVLTKLNREMKDAKSHLRKTVKTDEDNITYTDMNGDLLDSLVAKCTSKPCEKQPQFFAVSRSESKSGDRKEPDTISHQPITIPPRGTANVDILYMASMTGTERSLILLRNNLTVFDAILVKGSAVVESILIKKYGREGQSLAMFPNQEFINACKHGIKKLEHQRLYKTNVFSQAFYNLFPGLIPPTREELYNQQLPAESQKKIKIDSIKKFIMREVFTFHLEHSGQKKIAIKEIIIGPVHKTATQAVKDRSDGSVIFGRTHPSWLFKSIYKIYNFMLPNAVLRMIGLDQGDHIEEAIDIVEDLDQSCGGKSKVNEDRQRNCYWQGFAVSNCSTGFVIDVGKPAKLVVHYAPNLKVRQATAKLTFITDTKHTSPFEWNVTAILPQSFNRKAGYQGISLTGSIMSAYQIQANADSGQDAILKPELIEENKYLDDYTDYRTSFLAACQAAIPPVALEEVMHKLTLFIFMITTVCLMFLTWLDSKFWAIKPEVIPRDTVKSAVSQDISCKREKRAENSRSSELRLRKTAQTENSPIKVKDPIKMRTRSSSNIRHSTTNSVTDQNLENQSNHSNSNNSPIHNRKSTKGNKNKKKSSRKRGNSINDEPSFQADFESNDDSRENGGFTEVKQKNDRQRTNSVIRKVRTPSACSGKTSPMLPFMTGLKKSKKPARPNALAINSTHRQGPIRHHSHPQLETPVLVTSNTFVNGDIDRKPPSMFNLPKKNKSLDEDTMFGTPEGSVAGSPVRATHPGFGISSIPPPPGFSTVGRCTDLILPNFNSNNSDRSSDVSYRQIVGSTKIKTNQYQQGHSAGTGYVSAVRSNGESLSPSDERMTTCENRFRSVSQASADYHNHRTHGPITNHGPVGSFSRNHSSLYYPEDVQKRNLMIQNHMLQERNKILTEQNRILAERTEANENKNQINDILSDSSVSNDGWKKKEVESNSEEKDLNQIWGSNSKAKKNSEHENYFVGMGLPRQRKSIFSPVLQNSYTGNHQMPDAISTPGAGILNFSTGTIGSFKETQSSMAKSPSKPRPNAGIIGGNRDQQIKSLFDTKSESEMSTASRRSFMTFQHKRDELGGAPGFFNMSDADSQLLGSLEPGGEDHRTRLDDMGTMNGGPVSNNNSENFDRSAGRDWSNPNNLNQFGSNSTIHQSDFRSKIPRNIIDRDPNHLDSPEKKSLFDTGRIYEINSVSNMSNLGLGGSHGRDAFLQLSKNANLFNNIGKKNERTELVSNGSKTSGNADMLLDQVGLNFYIFYFGTTTK